MFLVTNYTQTHSIYLFLYFQRKTGMIVQVHKGGTVFPPILHGDSCREQLVSGHHNSFCLRLIRKKSLSELSPLRISPAGLEYLLQAARSRSFEYPPKPQDAASGVSMWDQLHLPGTHQLMWGSKMSANTSTKYYSLELGKRQNCQIICRMNP